jgi:hypothetical protein
MAAKLQPPKPLPFDELDPDDFSIEEQLAEAKREAALRRGVYAGWVRAGKMKANDAAYRYATMRAIVRTLERMAG